MKFILTIFVFMCLKIYELLYFIFTKVIPVVFLFVFFVLVLFAGSTFLGYLYYLILSLCGISVTCTLAYCFDSGVAVFILLLVLFCLCVHIIAFFKQDKKTIKQFFKDNWNKAEKIINKKGKIK